MDEQNNSATTPEAAATQPQAAGNTFTPAPKAEVVNQVGGDSWGC